MVNSNASGDNKSDNLQDLASDSAGNVVAVWVADNIAGLAGSGPEIYLAHSSDWGATWSTRARATTDPSFNTPRDWDPVVESDPDGNFVIAWESNSVLDGTLGTDIDIMKIRSSDGGVTWSSPMPLNLSAATDGNKVDAAPDIFRAPNGTWICAFSSTQSMGSYWDVRLWVSRSTDAGQTWSSEVSVFTSRAYSVLYPSVSGDADGNWIVSWHSPDSLGGQIGTDDDILFSRSGNDGLTWTAPRALNTHAGSDASNDAWVKIAPAGGGVWNAVWYSSYRLAPQANGTANNILLSRSLDNGITWSPATGIVAEMNSDSRNDSYPVIIRLNSGVWITAWPSKPTTADPSLGSDSDILYASSMDEGQTWNYQGALNIFADENDADDLFPMLAHGPAGKFLTIWSSGTNVSGLIQTDPDIFMSSVCQPTPTPSPTPSPSLTPTEIPTVTPTESPTRTPSLTPTASPVPDYDGAVVDVIFPPAVLPVQRHPIHVRMRNTGLATWTSADPVTLAAEDDPCDLLRGEALFLPPDLTVAPGGEALFRGWINTPDTPGDCPLTLRLTAAAPGSFGEAVELSFTVGDKLEIQLLTDWWGGAIAGSGQPIQPDTGGMCMVAPQSGDNILAWISPESYAQLVDLDVYRIRLDAATDQQTPDAIPLWDITYDNFTSGIGITYGGEIIFLDVAGGAQGIGRQQGRGVFELWAAPNAFLTPQWRGVTGDPAADANGAFTPQADAINDMRLLFRILDLDSAGVLADQDFGTICINRVRIDRMPFSAIGAEETLWAPPINSATHLAQRNDQMGAGMAIIDDAGARARYALLEGTPDPVSGLAPGSRKTLFPFEAAIYDPATPYAYAPFFPVQWTGDTLYMAEVWIESEAAPGAQPDPVDTVFVNLDVTTTELVSINVSLRGAPDIMNQAASPRRGAVAGGPQRFVGFMHSHNPAAVDLNAVPNADRLRAQADFINVPQIAPYAAGADPFSVTGLAVKRILTPFPLGEE